MKTLFEFKDYQSYLLYYFQLKRGNQARMAEHLNCRSSFLTQVIDQKVGLSLDQAATVPNFLGLSKNEKLAFVLLVQKDRVSEPTEKKFFEEQIAILKEKHNSVKERMNNLDELSEDAKSKYYSSWIYGAIHILCAFSWIRTVDDIVNHLKIEKFVANECVRFLLDCQLIQEKNSKLMIGKKQIHLGDDSPYIFNHHTNWRFKAIEKLNTRQPQLLNFSSLIGISNHDAAKIKEICLASISTINTVVQKSGEESAYLINIDFMQL